MTYSYLIHHLQEPTNKPWMVRRKPFNLPAQNCATFETRADAQAWIRKAYRAQAHANNEAIGALIDHDA
jgi:hypothetical protein